MSAIEFNNFSWQYAGSKNWALKEINLKIKHGEFIVITGPSGAGKTTLCLCMNGLIPQRINGILKGNVKILGKSTLEHDIYEFAKDVGMVYQDPETQFISMSVKNEIAFGMENFGVSREEMQKRLEWVLKIIRMEDSLDKSPIELSGGQKQRVAIASILVIEPKIFIFDEPTSDLDPIGRSEVYSVISKIREEKKSTIIMVEHNLEEVAPYADRFILMHDGSIILDLPKDDFFEEIEKILEISRNVPQISEFFYILRKKGVWDGKIPITFNDACEEFKKIHSKNLIEIKNFHSSKSFKEDKNSFNENEPIIIVKNLYYQYPDGTIALKNINLNIKKGEYLAIVGQNGSGKTTLVKHFNGLLKPTRGKVIVKGIDVSSSRVRELITHVGYVFQNPDHQLFCQTVFDEVMFNFKQLKIDEKHAKEKALKILESMDLLKYAEEHPFFLGKGQRRKLAIASVLSLNPEIIIVDEPTTGQDWKGSKEIMNILDRLNREERRTIIVITHNMRVVAEHCDRVIMMSNGRAIFDGSVKEAFTSEKILEQAFLKPPQITEFAKMLKNYGFKEDIITLEEMINSIEFKK
ncbi:MAG: energy-coupling factor transporter ATPase [Nitrososphaerota archaeon]